jgi:hypothetical protein
VYLASTRPLISPWPELSGTEAGLVPLTVVAAIVAAAAVGVAALADAAVVAAVAVAALADTVAALARSSQLVCATSSTASFRTKRLASLYARP